MERTQELATRIDAVFASMEPRHKLFQEMETRNPGPEQRMEARS